MTIELIIRGSTFAAGALLVMAVLYDVAYSTLSGRGAGPLLRLTARHVWHTMRLLGGAPIDRAGGCCPSAGSTGRASKMKRPPVLAGPVVLVAGLAVWIAGLWLGWFLVFMADSDAILAAQSRAPATWVERLYYAGFSITTLGLGDFVAGNGPWMVATAIAGLSGFTVLTLSVTFLLSLLGAVAEKRAVADYITALGASPQGLIRQGDELLEHVPPLVAALSALAQKYAAYPLLQYYHAAGANASLALRVAALAEAEVWMTAAAGDASRLRPVRRSIDSLLATLHEVHLEPMDEVPPLPDPDGAQPGQLRNLRAEARRAEDTRRSMLAFVRWEGWCWDDVHRDPVSA